MPATPKAFLFDLNGTMINDMEYHIVAWHRIVNQLGAQFTLEQMKQECYGKNNELLERIFPGRFSDDEKTSMGLEKEQQYQREFGPHLQLIDGLDQLLAHHHAAGVKMAIGSAAIMYNVNFVIDGLHLRHYFDALVSADDVTHSKPHPETWLKAAEQLKVAPSDCLVFEDNPKGVEAARAAGMPSLVITTMHAEHEFNHLDNIVGFVQDYKRLKFD